MTTVRTLISIATVRHWPLYQMDVKNAFLNNHLTAKVNMRPPAGLLHFSEQTAVTELGLHFFTFDSALFLRHTSTSFVALLLYVDDMIISGFDSSTISEVEQHLFCTFEMKDLGPLQYFLGIEAASSPKGYFLSQAKYANELNSIDVVPLDDPTVYRELVGCLVYLIVNRPDFAYAIHVS
ncbi:uncharacterized protein LOC114310443 [Camellia sinensis]|uniref:uncharacterized protein LOC114310443 n=1 Tax=Camellia sinensis TaxID=4442 RepID=UPI001035570B|nr:uncharacterized protein LOC114310443 [Camellia sinensis]